MAKKDKSWNGQLKNAAEDLNKVLGLEPPVETSEVSDEDLEAAIKEAGELVSPEDKLRLETREVISRLETKAEEAEEKPKKKGKVKVEVEEEEEEEEVEAEEEEEEKPKKKAKTEIGEAYDLSSYVGKKVKYIGTRSPHHGKTATVKSSFSTTGLVLEETKTKEKFTASYKKVEVIN